LSGAPVAESNASTVPWSPATTTNPPARVGAAAGEKRVVATHKGAHGVVQVDGNTYTPRSPETNTWSPATAGAKFRGSATFAGLTRADQSCVPVVASNAYTRPSYPPR